MHNRPQQGHRFPRVGVASALSDTERHLAMRQGGQTGMKCGPEWGAHPAWQHHFP
jgi:hypothetical protein